MNDRRTRIKIIHYRFQENDAMKALVDAAVARTLGVEPDRLTNINVPERAPTVADLNGADAVIIGGAKYFVGDDIPNKEALAEVLRAAREKKVPVFGICFGAQFIAHVFGGEVISDPANSEWGTFDMSAADESLDDILFADVPFTFAAQCAHKDRITKLPPGGILLASSPRCKVQAFVLPGVQIYGVQFHPERSKADYEAILVERGKNYAGDLSQLDAIRASLKDTPEAAEIMAKFIDRIVLQK